MNDKPQLTTREVEILKYRAMGLKIKEISKKLYISPKTVEHHWNVILFKFDCKANGMKAIYKAYQLGIISPPLQGELKEALDGIKNAKQLVARASEILKQFNQSVETVV
jgi:DNA-binding CsgD family transcriptional regulator